MVVAASVWEKGAWQTLVFWEVGEAQRLLVCSVPAKAINVNIVGVVLSVVCCNPVLQTVARLLVLLILEICALFILASDWCWLPPKDLVQLEEETRLYKSWVVPTLSIKGSFRQNISIRVIPTRAKLTSRIKYATFSTLTVQPTLSTVWITRGWTVRVEKGAYLILL